MLDGVLRLPPPNPRTNPISISAHLTSIVAAKNNVDAFRRKIDSINEEIRALKDERAGYENRIDLERAEADNSLSYLCQTLQGDRTGYASIRSVLDRRLFDEVATASAAELETPDGKVAYNPLRESKAQALMRAHGCYHPGYYPEERYDIGTDRSYWVWIDGTTSDRRQHHNPAEWAERYTTFWANKAKTTREEMEAHYGRPLEWVEEPDIPSPPKTEDQDDGA